MVYSGKQPIGTMLIQAGKLDEDQLQEALREQKEKDGYIGQTFVDLGFIDPKELNRYISYQLKIPYLQQFVVMKSIFSDIAKYFFVTRTCLI